MREFLADSKLHQTLLRCRFYDHLNTPNAQTKRGPEALSGGPDGVRTRDQPVKSRLLYLTELQAQCINLGFVADLHGVDKGSVGHKQGWNGGSITQGKPSMKNLDAKKNKCFVNYPPICGQGGAKPFLNRGYFK